MEQQHWAKIIAAYKNGKTEYFDRTAGQLFQKQYRRQLLAMTQSEEDAWDVFVEAMLKFREKYLLGSFPLPQNVTAYLFQMQRNVWLDICRKRNAKRQIQFKSLESEKIKQTITVTIMKTSHQLLEEQQQEEHHLVALEGAIGQLCEKCRSLLERHVFEGARLKALKIELGYTGSYQTIVEKKKRCIKKLTKLFFFELNRMENS